MTSLAETDARPAPRVPFLLLTAAVAAIGGAIAALAHSDQVFGIIWASYVVVAWISIAVWMGKEVRRAGHNGFVVAALVIVLWPVGMYFWAKQRPAGPILTRPARWIVRGYLAALGVVALAVVGSLALVLARGTPSDLRLARQLVIQRSDLPAGNWHAKGSDTSDAFLAQCMGLPATPAWVVHGPRFTLDASGQVASTSGVYRGASAVADRQRTYRSPRYPQCLHDALIHAFPPAQVSDVTVRPTEGPASGEQQVAIRATYTRVLNFWLDRIVIFRGRIQLILLFQSVNRAPDPTVESRAVASIERRLDVAAAG